MKYFEINYVKNLKDNGMFHLITLSLKYLEVDFFIDLFAECRPVEVFNYSLCRV